MDLIIVESPTKAKTLSRFLHGDFAVEATYGHVRDLPEKKIGIVIKSSSDGVVEFIPEYVVTKRQQDKIDEIQKKVKGATNVYLATDPDREGEAIAWHTAALLTGKQDVRFKRVTFHEITQKAIEEAMKSPKEVDMQMVNAQQARRILDRLVGYKLSPILWRKVRKGLSAGRVQSVAVRLVVEKEKEIEAFKAVEYWDIFAEVKNNQKATFKIQTTEKNGQKLKIGNEADARETEADLKKASYSVESVDKKEAKRLPLPPFTTSTLQQAGTSKFGWSAKKTMQVAQSLYEQGFITYHRTDSTNVAAEALDSAAQFIEGKWGKQYRLDKPRLYVTKSKVAQEAHEAIRPTDVSLQLAVISEQLNRDEHKLYELIWNRFVGCQMAEAILERVSVSVSGKLNNDAYGLIAKGETIVFDGWLAIGGSKDEENDEEKLPELEVGEKLDLVQIETIQKFTQPPARYNDASLIKTLEEMGIGRPSTYAPILSTIQDRQYVERVEKRFRPTPLGIAVNDFLTEHFSTIVDYQFTAKMEDELDMVANGEEDWQPVLAAFYKPFEKTLVTASESAARVKVEVENTGEKCPLCVEGEVVVRIGKFGRFLACSRYPECKYRANYVNKIGIACQKCGGDIIMRKTRSGKTFFGCSNYPKCDFASWTKPVAPVEAK
jgi:DNA topoisomerase-1